MSEFFRYDRSSGTRSRKDKVLPYIIIAYSTKINHIMVSLNDHYNAISIDRLSSNTKIGKDSWYFKNSLSCKTDLFSNIKNLVSSSKTQENNQFQKDTGGNTRNLVSKRMLGHFLKTPPLKKMLEIQG